jgi:hypothetical protein
MYTPVASRVTVLQIEYVYIHIYVHAYIHTYIHTYIHIHTELRIEELRTVKPAETAGGVGDARAFTGSIVERQGISEVYIPCTFAGRILAHALSADTHRA